MSPSKWIQMFPTNQVMANWADLEINSDWAPPGTTSKTIVLFLPLGGLSPFFLTQYWIANLARAHIPRTWRLPASLPRSEWPLWSRLDWDAVSFPLLLPSGVSSIVPPQLRGGLRGLVTAHHRLKISQVKNTCTLRLITILVSHIAHWSMAASWPASWELRPKAAIQHSLRE